MLKQDPPHFLNRLRLALHRVAKPHDQFRFHPLNMRAFVLDDPVTADFDCSITLHGNNRVRRDSLPPPESTPAF